jgi:hypothetical protein
VESQFQTIAKDTIPCLIHRFHRPADSYAEVVVLNFYVVNGEIVTDEDAFSGFMGRSPNIAGKKARYVAQIQISSGYEHHVLEAAHDIAELILEWLPADTNDTALRIMNSD